MPATNKKGMSATIGGRALDVNQRQRARRESEIARQTCRPCRSSLPIMPNSDIHIGNGEAVKVFADDVVDIGLERTGSASETKGHDKIFEVTITCTECCFGLVAKGDTEAVEGVSDVDLGEELGSFDTIKEL